MRAPWVNTFLLRLVCRSLEVPPIFLGGRSRVAGATLFVILALIAAGMIVGEFPATTWAEDEPAAEAAPEPTPLPEATPEETPAPEAAPEPPPSEAGDDWAIAEGGGAQRSFAFSGEALNRTSIDLVADNEFEDFATTHMLLYARGVYNYSERFSVTLSGLGEYLLRVNSEGHENGARYSGNLEEFYADLHFGRFDLRLGQQIVTWGRTDVFAPTDVINSVDTSRMIDTELGHYKIPNLMVKADYYWDYVNLEGIFIPFFRPTRIQFFGGDWALLGNHIPINLLINPLSESALGRDFLNLLNQQFPGWDDSLEEALETDRLNVLGPTIPEDDLQHSEFAARLGYNAGPVAGSASYFYGYDDLPTLYFSRDAVHLFEALGRNAPLGEILDRVLRLDPDELMVSRYGRYHQFGMDFEANLGPSVLRAEGAYAVNRRTYDEDLNVVERPSLTWTAGADYTLPFDIDFNLQYMQVYTPYWTHDLIMPQSISFLILYAHWFFLENRLEGYAQALYDASNWSMDGWREGHIVNDDFQFSGKMSYEFVPDLRIGAGAIVFAGPRTELFGMLHDRSFGFLDVKYSF